MQFEFSVRGLQFVTQHAIPVVYKEMALGASYRVDLIVEDQVVVEVKSVAAILAVHQAQTLTYMKLTGCAVGLLINFNVPLLKDGVKRLVLPGRGIGGSGESGYTRRNRETE